MDTEQVYIIEDIHPKDAYYHHRDELIGKSISSLAGVNIWGEDNINPGWMYVYSAGVEYSEGIANTFAYVKLSPINPPKKSFWQKLFTWSWK